MKSLMRVVAKQWPKNNVVAFQRLSDLANKIFLRINRIVCKYISQISNPRRENDAVLREG
jgi:hypothetical protein